MSDPINIEVKDGVDNSIRTKLLGIATAALEGYDSVTKLQTALDKIDASSVAALTKAQKSLEDQTNRNNLQYLAQETALNKAIAAEDKAAQAALALSTAQAKASTAADRLAASQASASNAVNAFGETEADIAARLSAVASAGAALSKQQQSIAITASEATSAEKTLAAATTASGTSANQAARNYSNYMSALNTLNKGSAAASVGKNAPGIPNPKDLNDTATASAGVTRELIVLGHEVISGNFSRIPGSMLVLAERTGGFAGAVETLLGLLSPLNIAIGLVVGAFALYENAVNSADKETRDFNNTLALTQGAAGLTIDSYNQLAQVTASANNVSIQSSKDLINQLEKGGNFQAEQLEQLADATIKLSKESGDSTKKIISDFQQLVDAPSKYAESLQHAYGIVISPAIQAHIKELEEQGNKAQATKELSKALYDYLQDNAPQALTGLSGLWERLGVSISNTLHGFSKGIADLKTGGTLTEQIKSVGDAITELEKFQALNDKQAKLGGPNSEAAKQAPNIADQLAAQREIQDELLGQANASQVAAENQANQTAALKESNTAAKALADTIDSIKTNGQKADEVIEKFENDFYKAINNPATQFTAKTQYAADHFAEIEAGLRAKFQKPVKATPATDDEKREAILAKVTAELDKQLIATDQLNDVRQVAQKLDQVDIQLSTHTKGGKLDSLQKLDALERVNIATKLQLAEAAKRVEAAQENIYSGSTAKAEQTFIDGETAIQNLLKNGSITADEAAAAQLRLDDALKQSANPLAQYNREMDQTNNLLKSNADANERAAQAQVNSINNQLRSQGKPQLLPDQAQSVIDQVTAQQTLNRVTQAYDAIVSANKGAYQQLEAQQLAYNKALDAGQISAEQYAIGTTDLAIARAKLNTQLTDGTQSDVMLASIGKLLDGYKGVLSGLTDAFGNFFSSINDGFANGVAKWIVEGGSLKDALVSVAQQGAEALIASLIKIGVQYLILQALGPAVAGETTAAFVAGEAAKTAAFGTGTVARSAIQATALATSGAASIAAAGVTAIAWAPAAALVSLASFGANAIAADAGLIATTSLAEGLATLSLAGFESGGFTGYGGRSSVAGVVHGQEFVVNAAGTAANRSTLEAMNRGQTVGNSAGPKITIENHGTPQTYTQVPSLSADEVRFIAKDEVRNGAGKAVAAELRNPNSDTSKSLKSSYQIAPNRSN